MKRIAHRPHLAWLPLLGIFLLMTTGLAHAQDNALPDLISRANDELLNQGNLDYADDVFSSSYADRGPEVIKEYVDALRKAFPDLQVTPGDFVVQGQRIAWRRNNRGTHQGEYMGFPGTGEPLEWRDMVISDVDGGKIIREVAVSDLYQQLTQKASFSADDAEAVRFNLKAFMSADPIDEPDAFFSQFTDDVHFTYNNLEPWVGIDELKSLNWCRTLSSEMRADRVEGTPALAYARGTYILSLDCGGEAPTNSDGVFLSVHRRQLDGSWRVESMLMHDWRP